MAQSNSDQLVRTLQWLWMLVFILLVGGIILWISHLIYTAWWLGDVPSASIGISLVAMPIFVVLLLIVLYVFWGLAVRGRGQ